MKWIRERILDILLISSIVTVASQRAFRSVPEVFPGGAAIGEVLATLATGFVGAWFFNLINIRLPKKREKQAVVGAVGVTIAQYASQARNILQDMALSLSMPPVPRKPDRRVLAEILGTINPNEASRTLKAIGPPTAYFTWIEYVGNSLRASRMLLDRITVAYPYLDADTVSAISAIDSTNLVRIVHNYPVFPQMGNTTLDALESIFWDHWVACSTLGDRYMVEIFPLIDERRRLHIDSEEQAASDGWSRVLSVGTRVDS